LVLRKGEKVTMEKVTTMTTVAFSELIDQYERARAMADAANKEKEELRNRIIEGFQATSMNVFIDKDKGRRVSVEVRLRKTISYREAEALLPADLLAKLTHESNSISLNVRVIKQEDDSDDSR